MHTSFIRLSKILYNYLENPENQQDTEIRNNILLAEKYNPWFIERFTNIALLSIAKMCEKDSIEKYIFDIKKPANPLNILVIAAGNIPLVCFHDIMTVLLSGHRVFLKPSSKDIILTKMIIDMLGEINPEIKSKIQLITDKIPLNETNAIIATGSNNTAQYFESYFSKYPKIIRKNRTSIAVLNEKESESELKNLADDILLYFGLGCRNVSKLLLPKGYDVQKIFNTVYDYGFLMQHHKYCNNYDYYRSIYLLNREHFLENNFLILKQSKDIHAPVAVLYYDFYESDRDIEKYVSDNATEIQCIVGNNHIPFGRAQFPDITDFADGINTKDFLMEL